MANQLLKICGIAMLVISVVNYHRLKDFDDLFDTPPTFSIANDILIAASCVMILTGVLGFFGALFLNVPLLISSVIGLFLVLAGFIAVLSIIFIYHTGIEQKVKESFKQAVESPERSEIRHYVQLTFECCGYNGKDDYEGVIIPQTCCSNDMITCEPMSPYVFKKACSEELDKFFRGHEDRIEGLLIALIIVTVASILLGILLLYFTFMPVIPETSTAAPNVVIESGPVDRTQKIFGSPLYDTKTITKTSLTQ